MNYRPKKMKYSVWNYSTKLCLYYDLNVVNLELFYFKS